MGRGRRRTRPPRPIPLEPVDLLAGLAPGVELQADHLPPGIAGDAAADGPLPAATTVAETGQLVRAGEATVRRLIRTTVLRPSKSRGREAHVERAGVPPRTRERPGE